MNVTSGSPATGQPPPARTPKPSFASRCNRKIASIFARYTRRTPQGPLEGENDAADSLSPPIGQLSQHVRKIIPTRPGPTQGIAAGRSSTPFPFNRLPYDIRVIIYSHLETSPPLAPTFQCLGFYLSCRQYKSEIEEFARDRLRILFAQIENTLSVKVAIKRGLDELRSITVVLLYAAFDDFGVSSSHPMWKREVLSGLHPLFAYPFDTLHIAISNEQYHASSNPEQDTQSTRYSVGSMLRDLIRDLSFMIECSNTCNHQANSMNDEQSKIEEIFKPGFAEEVPPYPTAKVRAKEICLSWDSRPFPHDQTPLSGRLVYADLPRPTDKRKAKALRSSKPLHPADLHTAMVYELSGADGSVGEIGIVSPMRWQLSKTEKPFVKHMVNSFDLHRGTIVSSKEVGTELEHGIAGARMQELEDEEDRRYKAAVRDKFEFDVFMACIEEGYFPDY